MPNVKVQIFQSCGSVAWLAKMITGAYGCGYCHAWLQNYVSTLEYCACAAEGKKQQCVCVTNLHIACKPHFGIARTTIKNNCWERHSRTLTLSSCSVNGNSVVQKRKAMIWPALLQEQSCAQSLGCCSAEVRSVTDSSTFVAIWGNDFRTSG